jgi:hypothetical protein
MGHGTRNGIYNCDAAGRILRLQLHEEIVLVRPIQPLDFPDA